MKVSGGGSREVVSQKADVNRVPVSRYGNVHKPVGPNGGVGRTKSRALQDGSNGSKRARPSRNRGSPLHYLGEVEPCLPS